MAEKIGAVADQHEELIKQADPLLRQLIVVLRSFVKGTLDQLRPEILLRPIVECVAGLVRAQQQVVTAMVAQRVQSEIRERLIDLMKG